MLVRRPIALAFIVCSTACCGVSPPKSPLPTPQAALDRVRATGTCGLGVQASAKIDHIGPKGRARGDLLLYAIAPASLRMDIVSPFGVNLATLTSDGQHFSLADLREKRFYVGKASACNIARMTTVSIPPFVLGGLLRGQPVLLKHEPVAVASAWNNDGYYTVTIKSTRQADQELHLAPHPDDWDKPWSEQRMRLLDVTVRQQGIVLYHASLSGHAPAVTAKPRVDPDGIDPPVPPSGPECNADIPRRIHVEVPGSEIDVLFQYDQVTWNPPIIEGLFQQVPVPGMLTTPVDCDDPQ
jgi:hypothetical protein